MKLINKTTALLLFSLLVVPFIATATTATTTTFEDPLGGGLSITTFLQRLIKYILSLLGFIALLALTYGGTMIIVGGMKSEQDLNRGKQIIFWAIAGLLIVGMAALILSTVGYLLGF